MTGALSPLDEGLPQKEQEMGGAYLAKTTLSGGVQEAPTDVAAVSSLIVRKSCPERETLTIGAYRLGLRAFQ